MSPVSEMETGLFASESKVSSSHNLSQKQDTDDITSWSCYWIHPNQEVDGRLI